MIWYVRLDGRVVGWVIAADHKEAFVASCVKFPGWDFEPRDVIPRPRKRRTAA